MNPGDAFIFKRAFVTNDDITVGRVNDNGVFYAPVKGIWLIISTVDSRNGMGATVITPDGQYGFIYIYNNEKFELFCDDII